MSSLGSDFFLGFNVYCADVMVCIRFIVFFILSMLECVLMVLFCEIKLGFCMIR